MSEARTDEVPTTDDGGAPATPTVGDDGGTDHEGGRPGFVDRQRQRREAWPDEWWEDVGGGRFGWTGTPKAVLVLLVILGAFAWGAYQVYQWGVEQLDPPGEPGETVVLSLGDGDTASNIADELEELGVIPNADVYRWYVRLKGGPGFQAGDYEFQVDSAAWDVTEVLAQGPIEVAQAVTFPVQFPEGFTVDEMVRRVDETDDLPYGAVDFAEALRDDSLYRSQFLRPASQLPEGVEELEGFLFPDTYFVQEGEPPSLLVERMMRRFDEVGEELRLNESNDLVGLDPYEVVVVASMIEEEARVDEDRAKIARVIYNRLEAGWQLGIDATVVYATGTNELTAEELEVDSPYNTRRFTGLPPTPIAAPGAASLEAALNPAEGDWFYYVLTEPDGRHTFAVTEEEFQAARQICIERDLGCG